MQQKDIPTLQLGDKENMELPTLKLGGTEQERIPILLRHERVLQIVLSLICLLLMYVLVSKLDFDFSSYYRYSLKPAIVRYWPNALAAVGLLVIAYNIYLFRAYARLWFGMAEIVLAMGLGWYSMNKAASGSVQDAIVIFFAAIYLAGRGFVNISHRFSPLLIEDQDKK